MDDSIACGEDVPQAYDTRTGQEDPFLSLTKPGSGVKMSTRLERAICVKKLNSYAIPMTDLDSYD